MAIKLRAVLKGLFSSLKRPSGNDFADLIDSTWLKSETINVNDVMVIFGTQTLTYAATTIYDINLGGDAEVTLTGDTILQMNNLHDGQVFLLSVIQGGTGNYNITLPAGSIVNNGGGGAIILTPTVGGKDLLVGRKRGAAIWWTYRKNFT